jgi:uncharacterized protein (TIGR00299 family) protein
VSRIVHFDCASGASGDMILGALVDLGLPIATLEASLRTLPVDGYRLEARNVSRSGLRATQVEVVLEHPERHHHRGLREVLDILDKGALEPHVTQRCARLFRRLAEVEGAVHGTSPESVHFHEVGAVDSIVDIVGGVLGLSLLAAERFVSTPLNLGAGTVTMSHGTFPVPPPATALLVKGVPVYGSGESELLTPTGALLLTDFVTEYGPLPALRPEGVGHGAGARDTPHRPNVLRMTVGEGWNAGGTDTVLVLEAQVDDSTGQFLGALMERLFEAGALDAFLTPIQMKKGRPGNLITVLAPPPLRQQIEEILFAETTTLGVRRQEWTRSLLDRRIVPVSTPFGEVRIKVGHREGVVYGAQPEFEDCRRAARASKRSVKEVWTAALLAYERLPR